MMLPWKKSRTRLGVWMDKKGITQTWLSKETGYSSNTITHLCGNIDYIPRSDTRTKVIRALRKIDPNISASDFW